MLKDYKILSYDTLNREYTESQLRNEAIAEDKYARIEEENLVGLIDEIRHIASVQGFSGFFHSQLNNLHRRATRGQRKFLEPFMSLYEYVHVEKLLGDLPNVYEHATTLRKYHNAAIFWALDDSHSFKRDMKGNFPEGEVFTAEQIKKKITTIYRTHFHITITTDSCVDILREFLCALPVYKKIDGKTQRVYRIESHNKNGYVGQPVNTIPSDMILKPLLKFSQPQPKKTK